LKIKVNCIAPKYVRGDYEFHTFEELYNFLFRIKGLAKKYLSTWLYAVAKDGSISMHSARCVIEIKSDFHDYDLANKVAQKVGRFKDPENRNLALIFAKTLDKEIVKRKEANR